MRRAAELELALSPRPAGQTLQHWLYQELRAALLSGRLPAGARLPPSRELARQQGVSRSTVLAVYEQLSAEGYLHGAVGRGTTVATRLPAPQPTPRAPASTALRSVSAEQIEPLVVSQIKAMFIAPEIISQVHRAAQAIDKRVALDDVRKQLAEFSELWGQLFPLEQNRILQLIVKRITIAPDSLNITFHQNGVAEIYEKISGKLHAS